MADRDIREPLDEIGSRTVACFTRVRYASAHLTVWKRWPLGLPADAGLQTIFVIKLCNMKKLITALVGQPKNVGVAVAALLTAGQLRSEEYCARAAECQGIADHGPILSNSSTKIWRVSGGHSPSGPKSEKIVETALCLWTDAHVRKLPQVFR
jgi:hypothetical protein